MCRYCIVLYVCCVICGLLQISLGMQVIRVTKFEIIVWARSLGTWLYTHDTCTYVRHVGFRFDSASPNLMLPDPGTHLYSTAVLDHVCLQGGKAQASWAAGTKEQMAWLSVVQFLHIYYTTLHIWSWLGWNDVVCLCVCGYGCSCSLSPSSS